MKEQRFFYVPDAATANELPTEEAMHAMRVLRLRSGDEMMLMDGRGVYYRAEITLAATHHCLYRIVETLPQQPQWRGHLHLAIAPTKMMDRMEWMLEKATEIGVDEVSFLNCHNSERKVMKTVRADKIVVAATKQSHKAWKPTLNEMMPFNRFIEQPREGRKYIAHCYDEIVRADLFTELRRESEQADVTVLIGPEGDFSPEEVSKAIKAGYKSVSLGASRLRTETAGLSAVMMMQLAQVK